MSTHEFLSQRAHTINQTLTENDAWYRCLWLYKRKIFNFENEPSFKFTYLFLKMEV